MKRVKFTSYWLIVFMFLIIAVGFSVTSVLSFLVTKQYVTRSEITHTLPLISDNIYSSIKEDLIDPINISSLMSNDTFLINWVNEGEEDLNAITEYLRYIKEEYGYTSAFFVSDQTRNYYYYDGILKQISPEDAHDIWYYLFVEMNTAYDLDVDQDEAARDTLTVFINHRLEQPDGTFLGVTGVGLKLTDIGANLLDYENRYDHRIYMIDSQGLIQIHADASLVEQVNIREMEGLEEISQEILDTDQLIKIKEYRDAEGVKIISVRYIPEFDWFLIVEKNQSGSLVKARQSLWQNIIIGLAVTIGISALIYWIFRKYNMRLEYLASVDELTELFNRRFFLRMLTREMNIAQRYGQDMCLLMLDIDDFKAINDEYGHLNGDKALREITQAVRNATRNSDIVARWGGEEFIILLLNTDEALAAQIAERIRATVEQLEIHLDDHTITRTVSIGCSKYDHAQRDAASFIAQADAALIQSKEQGKNCVMRFEASRD
ncbi:MAG: diguanylate cyclase [Anaerolineaceae bacterium]|nr:diguanylate cyclase [Anaerolineaceae bacterium]